MKKRLLAIFVIMALILSGCGAGNAGAGTDRGESPAQSGEETAPAHPDQEETHGQPIREKTGHLAGMQCLAPDGKVLESVTIRRNGENQTEYVLSCHGSYEGEETKTYDGDGRLLHCRATFNGEYSGETVYHYDVQRRLIRSERTTPNGYSETVDYTYDSNGLLVQKTKTAMGEVEEEDTYTYNARGQMTKSTRYIPVSNYHYIITEYTYDDADLLMSAYAECYESLECEPIGYMSREYTYDEQGRVAAEVCEENIYGGNGGRWNRLYDYSCGDLIIERSSGTDDSTVIHILHGISGEEVASYSIWDSVTIIVEDGLLTQVKTEDRAYHFRYE